MAWRHEASGAEAAGTEVRRGATALPGPDPGASAGVEAVVTPWPQSGPDAGVNLRRLLRRLRPYLPPDGVLIVRRTPPPQGRAASSPAEWGGAAPAGGRLLPENSLTRELRDAGFAVLRADDGLTGGPAAAAGSGASQIMARALPAPPDSLAVTSWRTPAFVRLDLRYAPDEAELLDPSPGSVWEDLVRTSARGGADIVGHYAVDDPFGGERGAEAVARHFDCPLAPHQLTFAAGVTSLLHDLGGLADGGLIAAPEWVHADLEAWAVARGGEFKLFPETSERDRLIAQLKDTRPALLHLDRPAFTGQVIGLDDLAEVTEAASRVGAVVLIDESPAPYLGPHGSAVRLVNRADNLVVLRGFTKAYSMGGLRVGFAVASEGVARHVRELVSPLQVSELALHAALRLLDAGDFFGRLLARIRLMKPAATALLKAAGLEVIPGHTDLPWVAVSDAGGAASRILEPRGICALRPAPAPAASPRPAAEVMRLTVPLSDERMALLRRLMEGDGGEGREP